MNTILTECPTTGHNAKDLPECDCHSLDFLDLFFYRKLGKDQNYRHESRFMSFKICLDAIF